MCERNGLLEGPQVLLDEFAKTQPLGKPPSLFPADLFDVGAFTESPIGHCVGSHPAGLAQRLVGKRIRAFFDHVQSDDPATVLLGQVGLLNACHSGHDTGRLADLSGADLEGAKADDLTVWPDGFDPEAAGVIFD